MAVSSTVRRPESSGNTSLFPDKVAGGYKAYEQTPSMTIHANNEHGEEDMSRPSSQAPQNNN